jgi:IclR family KDG regulon transcriptional repressor
VTSDDGQQYAIRAVDRAVDVLVAFREEPVLSLPEVAKRANLTKPTAFRVLSSLRRRGFVSQTPNGDYELGYQILGLAAAHKRRTKIVDEALRFMNQIRDAVDETVLLCVRVDDDRFILEAVESRQEIRRVAKIGERVPLYAGASSRVLLAGQPDHEIEAYLERTKLIKLGANTITDKQHLRRELATVRELGYAIGSSERRVGGTGVAVAVRDYTAVTVAALQVTVPTERWTNQVRVRCLQVLARAATALSAHLGDSGPHPAQHLVEEDHVDEDHVEHVGSE